LPPSINVTKIRNSGECPVGRKRRGVELDSFLVSPELNYIKTSDIDGTKHDYGALVRNFDANGAVPVAILPWKLLRSSTLIVHREEKFVDKHSGEMTRMFDIIGKLRKATSHLELLEKFTKFYPKSKYLEKYRDECLEAQTIPELLAEMDLNLSSDSD
jgi:hypothetical protein